VGQRWDQGRVHALAPDAASLPAARRLALASGWSGEGATDVAVWGLAPGSGATPYRTAVDLAGPAYSCSCPSRKIPCKHVLALLLRWTSGTVPDADVPAPFVREWLDARAERAARAAGRADADPAAAAPRTGGRPALRDPAAAARRVQQRAERVSAGLDELDRWLADQVRTGLASHQRDGYARVEAVAARMVDAQAPGVASWLRRLPGTAVGDDWASRLLEQYGLMRLLVAAHRRLDELDPSTAATVRSVVGYPVSTEQVLAGPAVPDVWVGLAVQRREEERLTVQRTWLRGATTGRWALLLAFAPSAATLEVPVAPGAAVEADLHFHPGARPLRAVLGERRTALADPPPLPAGGDVAAALAEHAAAHAADPWTSSVPVRLDDVRVALPPQPRTGTWALVDATGAALPLRASSAPAWSLLSVGAGRALDVVGTWSTDGLEPLVANPAGADDRVGWRAA
jgi:hypothetical protein